ncbi:MAG: hypothetical protein JST05_01315 [Acidobacteria bacterium]|nr:hypothetical protein [Acidobacteriota bacterium]
MIPRTPPGLRRKLDRIARRAHAFHRFAHHPLCVEYAQERIRLGRVHLCRGCVMLAMGLATGFAAGALAPARAMGAGLALSVAIAAGLAAFGARLPKSLGRALPGAALGFAFIQGLRLGARGWAWSGGAAMLFAAAFLLYRRKGPHRGPCETCPDRDQRPACRGFSPILRRERAVQRMAGKLVAAALRRP